MFSLANGILKVMDSGSWGSDFWLGLLFYQSKDQGSNNGTADLEIGTETLSCWSGITSPEFRGFITYWSLNP